MYMYEMKHFTITVSKLHTVNLAQKGLCSLLEVLPQWISVRCAYSNFLRLHNSYCFFPLHVSPPPGPVVREPKAVATVVHVLEIRTF
jgi:hypothetical protein